MGASTSKVSCDAPPPLPAPGTTLEIPDMELSSSPPPPAQDSPESPPPAEPTATPSPSPEAITNPGPYEAATMPSKRITSVDTFSGFKCDIQKQLSPYMVAIHSFHLGTSLPNGQNKNYMFITQVADEEGLFMANFDPIGKSINGRIHRALLGGLAMGKIQCAVSGGAEGGQGDQLLAEVDFGGMTWSGNLKYGSMGGGLVYGMNYYQSITKNLALGGEGMYIAANGNMLSSYTCKYECDAPAAEDALKTSGEKPSSWFCAQLNPAQGMLNLGYKRVVTPNRVTLGADLSMTPDLQSTVTLGAEFNLSRSRFACAVDGEGKIQSNLETALGMAPGSPKLNFSAEVDYQKDSMVFGYGLNIG